MRAGETKRQVASAKRLCSIASPCSSPRSFATTLSTIVISYATVVRWFCADRSCERSVPHCHHFPGALFRWDPHTMADTSVVREENPGQFHGTKQGWEDHVHQQNVKKGIERQDRRSANPNKGAVKKHGHGGKFTVDGPYHDEDYAEAVPAAMDKNDPNYVDPSEEQADEAAGVSVVEVAKVEATGAGTDYRPSQANP